MAAKKEKYWGVALRKNIVVEDHVDRSESAYPAKSYTIYRWFKTRKEARIYKKNRTGNPVHIIDLRDGHVVR